MKQDLTQITIVLDRSGSMQNCRDATIASFNEFVDGQKVVPGAAYLTLIQFDTENPWQIVFDKPIQDIPKMTLETFVPRGGTPLHDAIGKTIDDLGMKLSQMNEEDRPSKVVIVIMTDGLENASREYKSTRIAEMIKHQHENYKWEFVFLGANQDAILTGEKLGILAANSVTFSVADPLAVQSVTRSTSQNLASYRIGASKNMAYSNAQRKSAITGKENENS